MTITVYSFEDHEGEEIGGFTTQNHIEARDYARANKLRMIANILFNLTLVGVVGYVAYHFISKVW